MAYNALIPIIVLTGFLGSGKTTLLNRILKHPSLHDAAVLINEFGQIGLDHMLVERMDENTVVLESGCLCCTIRDDLKTSILELHGRRARGEVPPFQRMVIETTGLADPSPILYTLTADTMLRHHYRVGSVVVTVDAVNAARQLDRQPETVKQIAVADRIVVTKTDIATPGATDALGARLAQLNPSAAIQTALFGDVDIDELLRADVYDPAAKGGEVARWLAAERLAAEGLAAAAPKHGHAHDVSRHGPDIQTFSLVYDEPIDWTAFGIWLTMRCTATARTCCGSRACCGSRTPTHRSSSTACSTSSTRRCTSDRWPDGDRRSRIVFIVRGIDRERLAASLATFARLGGTPEPATLA